MKWKSSHLFLVEKKKNQIHILDNFNSVTDIEL